jgi:hypothetical protein
MCISVFRHFLTLLLLYTFNSDRLSVSRLYFATAESFRNFISVLSVSLMSGSVNLKEPCVLYIGQASRYPPNTPFYIFFQQKYTLNFLNMLHTLRFFSLQNAVYFIMLPFLFPVLFAFYIQGVLKLKYQIPVLKG